MQKYKILFLIVMALSCRHKKISKIWEFPKLPAEQTSFFMYGIKPELDVEVDPENPPTWGPALKVSDEAICVYSQDDFFRSKEFGPRIGVCLEPSDENQTLLSSALVTLNELDETKLRPDGYLNHEGVQIHLHFLSETEIVNEINASSSRSFLLGDNRLHTALAKRMDLSFENHKSIAGIGENRIETSFSLPYFSVYTIDGAVKLVFPPMDSAIPRSQFHYLVLDLTNLPEFTSNFQSNFGNIQGINESWKANCSKEKLEITEVMGYASGSTKRFLEWSGSKENSNCVEDVSLAIAGKKIDLEAESQFIFPGAVKLFVETDSPLQGIVLKNANWKEIKSLSTLQLNSNDLTDTWKLPENVNFNWAEEEFSLKKKLTSCEWSSAIIRNSILCGDPGIELEGLAPTAVTTTNPSSTSTGSGTGNSQGGNTEINGGGDPGNGSPISTGSSAAGNTGSSTAGDTGSSTAGNTGSSTVGNTGSSAAGNTGSSAAGNTGSSAAGNTEVSVGGSANAGTSTSLEICKSENFTLTELNAFGLRQETKLDKTGKFIELYYIGVNTCKLIDLTLLVGTTSVPLFGASTMVPPNSYWLITDGKHFTGITNLIRRNLDFMLWQNPIVIKNLKSSSILWSGLKPEDEYIAERMNGNISSMVFRNEKFYHHPGQKSSYLQAAFRATHSMSPGEANSNALPDVSGELSEILWAGAYKNSISIPDEKFIEIKTKGEGTLELEVTAETKFSRFFIPVSAIDTFTVLSKSRFQCFPNARSIVSDKLVLSDGVTSLRLKLDGVLLSEVSYDPQRGNGLSSSALKIRSSFVNSGTLGLWKTSTVTLNSTVAPDCKGSVFATPESLNEFEPFLADENFDYLGTGKFYLATSLFNQNVPYSVKLYSYLPQAEEIFQLQKNGNNNLLGTVGNLLGTPGLYYQKLENYNDLKIYNQDGVFVEGILTNPSISQNEWILLCNRTKLIKDLVDYEIQDEDSVDRIESYMKRMKTILPSGLSSASFQGNSTLLLPGQCGYLVDPEAYGMNLKPMGIAPTLVLTVKSTSTIGNGLSSGEAIDLFKYIGKQRIHVHSFGNRYSHAPFTIPISKDEIILLLPGKRGEGRYDYEALKW